MFGCIRLGEGLSVISEIAGIGVMMELQGLVWRVADGGEGRV